METVKNKEMASRNYNNQKYICMSARNEVL